MLLFLFAVVVFVICIIASILLENSFSNWSVLPFALAFILGIVIIASTIVFICQAVNRPIDYANVEAERDIIVYQVEHHDSFLETSRIGVNELYYTQVKEFNAKVRMHQFLRKNPWTSWYEQPFWSEIELIDYTEGS